MCFVQAEDGIRVLVRSRGLGDVYKRQGGEERGAALLGRAACRCAAGSRGQAHGEEQPLRPVSYTHLTLPTSDLV